MESPYFGKNGTCLASVGGLGTVIVLGCLHLSQLPIVPPQSPLETRCENLLKCHSGAPGLCEWGGMLGRWGSLLVPHGQWTRGAHILPPATLAVPDQNHTCPCNTSSSCPRSSVDCDLKPWGRSCAASPLAWLCHRPGWHVPQPQQGSRPHFLCTAGTQARSSSFLEKLTPSRLGGETEAQSWEVAAQL